MHELIYVTFEQFMIAGLNQTKAYSTCEQYNMKTSTNAPTDKLIPREEDSVYCRSAVLVIPLSVEGIKKQFIEQLNKPELGALILEGGDQDALVKQADKHILDNFGTATHLVSLNEDDEKTTYVLLDSTYDTMTLRLLSPAEGAFILFNPLRCVVVEVSK